MMIYYNVSVMPYNLCIFTWIEKVAFSRAKKGQKMQLTASFVDLATMHVNTRREVHESASFFLKGHSHGMEEIHFIKGASECPELHDFFFP